MENVKVGDLVYVSDRSVENMTAAFPRKVVGIIDHKYRFVCDLIDSPKGLEQSPESWCFAVKIDDFNNKP